MIDGETPVNPTAAKSWRECEWSPQSSDANTTHVSLMTCRVGTRTGMTVLLTRAMT
jgi:hypothetical protein